MERCGPSAGPLPSRPASPRGIGRRTRRARGRHDGGFTLIELLVVLLIVGISAALVSLGLRDSAQSQLENEAARLAALLESARAEARASGLAVRWETAPPDDPERADFRFVGLPPSVKMPQRWLAEGVHADIVGARALRLGPEPLIGAQQVVLRYEDHRLALGTDGLGPFEPVAVTENAQ